MTPPPGVTLRPCDWPHWRAVVEARPSVFWTPLALALAAQLARCVADIERVQASDDGTDPAALVANAGPLLALTIRSRQLRGMIGLHPRADGERRDRRQREAITRRIETRTFHR